MHSSEELNSFFGGMAAPEWNSEGNLIEDPIVGECSWLFKLEARENKYFYLFIKIEGSIFINGNAFKESALLLDIKAYLF